MCFTSYFQQVWHYWFNYFCDLFFPFSIKVNNYIDQLTEWILKDKIHGVLFMLNLMIIHFCIFLQHQATGRWGAFQQFWKLSQFRKPIMLTHQLQPTAKSKHYVSYSAIIYNHYTLNDNKTTTKCLERSRTALLLGTLQFVIEIFTY